MKSTSAARHQRRAPSPSASAPPRLTHRAAPSLAQRRQLPRSSRSRSSSAGASATSTASRCAAARARRRTSSTRARRRPTAGPAPTTSWRACSRTSSRATRRCRASTPTARAAGTATACRSRSPSRTQLGIESKDQIEEYGIAEFNAEVPRVRLRVPRGLDAADRADRLLGRPRRPLPHARHELHRVGLVGAQAAVGQGPALRGLQGRPVLPARRHVALLARGLAGLQGRRGPERLRALPGHQAGGRAARGRHAAGLDDDAVDAGLQRRRGRRPRAHLRALDRRLRAGRGARRARARRGRRGRRSLQGRRHGRRGLRAAVPVHPRLRVRREGPHRAARRTSSPPRTAPASSTPRSRSARTTSGSAPSTA